MTAIEKLENRLRLLELRVKTAKCNKQVDIYLKQAIFVKQQINKLKSKRK